MNRIKRGLTRISSFLKRKPQLVIYQGDQKLLMQKYLCTDGFTANSHRFGPIVLSEGIEYLCLYLGHNEELALPLTENEEDECPRVCATNPPNTNFLDSQCKWGYLPDEIPLPAVGSPLSCKVKNVHGK